MEKIEEQPEEYLGDGLYASFDGYMITLRAPRFGEDHWIGLEPQVYRALLNYAQRCWAQTKTADQGRR
jgi:hypothetical protein